MSELPCCRLCGSDAMETKFSNITTCQNEDCRVSNSYWTEAQWRRLMFVPAKQKLAPSIDTDRFTHFKEGYNAAIDAMDKGG